MHLAWLLVLFVPVYKQLVHTQNKIMLPIINQRILNRLIIVPALSAVVSPTDRKSIEACTLHDTLRAGAVSDRK